MIDSHYYLFPNIDDPIFQVTDSRQKEFGYCKFQDNDQSFPKAPVQLFRNLTVLNLFSASVFQFVVDPNSGNDAADQVQLFYSSVIV